MKSAPSKFRNTVVPEAPQKFRQKPAPIKLPKAVFDGLHKVWAALGSADDKYRLDVLRKTAKTMGESALLSWLDKHPDKYPHALWDGAIVDEHYPGD